MERDLFLDLEVLCSRSFYFEAYFTFYKEEKGKRDFVDIQIPFIPLLTIFQCFSFIQYLSLSSIEESYAFFNAEDCVESIAVFACFFQSEFLFKYLLKRALIRLEEISKILKVYFHQGNICHHTSCSLIYFCSDLIGEDYPMYKVLKVICCNKHDIHHYCSYNCYRDKRLGKKIKKVAGEMFDDVYPLHYYCATCGLDHSTYPEEIETSTKRMECCGSYSRRTCYLDFKFHSFLRPNNIFCKDCQIKWEDGKPSCSTIFMKWQRKRYAEMRESYYYARIKFYSAP